MSRTTKRFLSILLAAAMILSLGVSGWANDDIELVDPSAEVEIRPDLQLPERTVEGTELNLEEIDPSTLNVPKLGEIEDDEINIDIDEISDLNEVVRVSIILNRPATLSAGYSAQNFAENKSAVSYRQALKQQQATVEAAIASAGVSMNVKWNLTLIVNAISAEVRYGDIETIKQIPGVKEVWLETRYEPQKDEINTANTTEYMVGATALWKSGYTGAGARVAIIDTGTDQDHQSFDPSALEYALETDGLTPNLLTWDEINAVKSQLNVSVTEQVYKNTKIPFAYNYVDGGYVTDHVNDKEGEHGSHVSGIAAANRYVKVNGEFVDAAENVFAVGVAPDAQIITMKVFGAGGGAYDSDYMTAIEDAIVLKADAINLSLGSGYPGFTFSNGYQEIMDGLVNSGSVVSISAGNSYSWADFIPNDYPYLYLEDISLHTGGSPGSFTNSLGVAAANNVGTVAAPMIFNGDQTVTFSEDLTDSKGVAYGNPELKTIAGSYEYVFVPGPGVDDDGNIGKEGDAFFALGSEVLNGKIAMCMRGTSSFFAKANAAAAQGAAGVIIVNNQSGVIHMNLSGYEYKVPVVSILQADGQSIAAASTPVTDEEGNVLYYTGSVEITSETKPIITDERENVTITDFSSWGVPGSLIMKPEITAPGGNIYSVFGTNQTQSGAITGGSDQYEFMSGTSMAAPHITGMAALLGQYVRENDLETVTGLNARTLINSLLMSTATPMIVDGAYLPILQQGSGLGDTFAATQAKSYILMDEKATSGAADGKVKVELGQDAAREGVYSFSFSVNNFSDAEMTYELSTDMFTQGILINDWYLPYGIDLGSDRLDTAAWDLAEFGDYSVSYAFEHLTPNPHDVNKDGATDKADAQAVLDYLTGKITDEGLDLAAGEMDGVEGLSTYDAQLLLTWEAEAGADDLVVPAGESVTVTVTITYSDDLKDTLDDYLVNGAWIEGFTYVTPITTTAEGEVLGVEHSIPILGFYGSFTDASMFDCVDAISAAYGSPKVSYTGHNETNYLTVNYGKGDCIFMGNPYAVEEEIPYSRFALSSSTQLVNFKYNLIRNAGTTGWMILDDSLDVIKSGAMTGNTNGAWYYVNGQEWRETGTKSAKIGTTAGKLGLKEGDTFLVGEFAIPEYYGMQLNPGANVNTVTPEQIAQLLADKELGNGSYIGYSFLIDDTVPTITSATLSEDKSSITITAKDDNYIAYVAIVDLTGKVFVGEVPEQSATGEEVTVTLDATGLEGAVAAFVGDYAANENASLIRISGEGPVPVTEETTIEYYRPATSLVSGGDYIIVSADTVGKVKTLDNKYGSGTLVVPTDITVEEGTLGEYTGKYVLAEGLEDSFRWYATPCQYGAQYGYTLQSVKDDAYLTYQQDNTAAAYTWTTPWKYENNMLTCVDWYTDINFYISWDGTTFMCSTTEPSTHLYLYVRDSYTEVNTVMIDPENASSVTVYPDDLLMMVGETAELKATVEPLVLPDKSVTWSSADESVATVDENGLVTAVAGGETVITAASVTTPEVVGTASVKVLSPEPIDAVVYGQVAYSDDNVQFVGIDLNDMSVSEDYANGNIFSYFYGGTISGGNMYGNDVDNDFHRYVLSDTGFTYDGTFHFVIEDEIALIDGACFPSFTIADYSKLDDDGNPTLLSYAPLFAGIDEASDFLYWTGNNNNPGGWSLSSLYNLTAACFAGAGSNATSGIRLYFMLLADDGTLVNWVVYPNLSTGRLSAGYGVIGKINGLSVNDDKSVYSMSYYEIDDDNWGVLIADSSIGGIYYANLAKLDSNSEVDIQFAGLVEKAISLTTLSDMGYDMVDNYGTIPVNQTSTGSIELPGAEAPEFLAEMPLAVEEIAMQDFLPSEPAFADDDIAIGDEGDDEIIVVGGLDAIRNIQTRRSMDLLKAGELVNPSYEEDGYVEIAITTPDATEEVDKFYNGFATLEYDPAALSFQSLTPNAALEITSYTVDEEAGLIKFAYASTEPVEAGAVANVKFSTPSKSTVITVTTVEANDDLDVNDVTEIKFGDGFKITVEDFTKEKATVTGIEAESLYSGEVSFNVASGNDQAVLVAIKEVANDGTESYTVIPCVTGEDGTHSFKITVDADVTIALVFRGDVNLDARVNLRDAQTIKNAIADELEEPLTAIARLAGDANNDKRFNLRDAQLVKNVIAGDDEIAW